MENYLYHITFNERSAICTIRKSANPIEVEKGYERLCTFYSMNTVENEKHLLVIVHTMKLIETNHLKQLPQF